jgi:hypothetical protein
VKRFPAVSHEKALTVIGTRHTSNRAPVPLSAPLPNFGLHLVRLQLQDRVTVFKGGLVA